MILKLKRHDFLCIHAVVNDAAFAYKGVIPQDRWHEPYMTIDELHTEISRGVDFWGAIDGEALTGVMGIQRVGDVTLIRHAYVKTLQQHTGVGSALLRRLQALTRRPLLIGTWAAATWAVNFYRKNGFTLVTEDEKTALLRKYWSIPDRQIETSVVLADDTWLSLNRAGSVKTLSS
jgi:GNAT superfamily N-acetyltransferase